jgi:hypothetical protein
VAETASARLTRSGRISFAVDLGSADTQQEYTNGATSTGTSRTVTFVPHRARSAARRPD